MLKNVFIVLTICSLSPAHACIWRNGAEAFWPSNKIEVCFVAQEQGPDYRLHTRSYNEARLNVQKVFENEINQKTKFELFGFKTCDGVPPTRPIDQSRPKAASPSASQAPAKMSPMVRIDLTRGESGAIAASIGPSSKESPTNISMGYLDRIVDKASGKIQITPTPKERQQWMALHELLHLLGFCHEDLWGESAFAMEEKGDCVNAVQVGSSADQNSVMMRGGVDAPHLSERDLQCLDLVATKEILNYGKIPSEIPSEIPQSKGQSPDQRPATR